MRTILAILFFQFLLPFASVQSSRDNMCKIKFSQKSLIVHFSPYVKDGEFSSYKEADLMPMIRTIATRFSKLEVASVTNKEKVSELSHIHIPNAVATFNSNEAPQKLGKSKGFLQVIIRFDVYNRDAPLDDKKSSFHIVKELADNANKIYPGTVSTLAFDYFELNENNVEQMKQQLLYAKRSIISNSSIPYELAVCLYIHNCESTGMQLREYMKKVVDSADFIFFDLSPKQFDHVAGVDKSAEYFIQRFKTCTRKLQTIKPTLKIGFRTSWQDTDFDGHQNISGFIRFWDKINSFASSSGTPIIISEAFDQPYHKKKYRPYHTQGWWRLREQDTPYKTTTDYIFEEKCSLVITTISKSTIKATTVTTSKTFKFSMVATIALLSLVLLQTIYYIYEKLKKNRNVTQDYDEEIHEFFKGGQKAASNYNTFGEISKINTFAYDESYEIPLSSFTLDESSSLGSGEFGTVFLGKVKRDDDEEITTAVKRSKPNSSLALKSLMGEIKVLSYLGKHENIVSLIGACTTGVKKGTLLVFLELCSMGSLEKYLRGSCTEGFRDGIVRYSELPRDNIDKSEKPNGVDIHAMRKWCIDIVKGMEYLTSKNLVHGDLATRNVLLDKDKRAKICDFGLSRRLYNYSTYLKSHVEPLPWRWMSPESLRRLEFNEKTDVWSFGVTVWEICSFGDVPYPGLAWTLDFSSMLESGLRLQKPPICPSDLYDIILRCWNINPLSRPTFSELTHKLDSVTG